MKDNWKGVINDCVQIQAYPTVLLYEKLNYVDGYEIHQKIKDADLQSLIKVAEIAEEENSEMVDMFSQEEIKRQFELFNKH